MNPKKILICTDFSKNNRADPYRMAQKPSARGESVEEPHDSRFP